VTAAAAYFGIVFALGFVLGTVRVLAVAPRLGETAAVLIEAPLMLAASWIAARWCVRRFAVPARDAPRLAMGVTAFALLMGAELLLSVLVFGRTPAEHLAGYARTPGALGLAAQALFALAPWIEGRVARARA
jgi:hypothetical protein